MKETLRERFENLMVAVTFAESNQHDFALKLMSGQPGKKQARKAKSSKKRLQDQQPRLRM